MTTEEKFRAAVNVIRNLPKNGSYQPSTQMMLSFYAYFKQATDGWENRGSRPPFWEVVKRAKWDAWNRLDKMSKEEAMNKYVEELNKVTEQIIETMSLTDNVADFLTSMDQYPGNLEDLSLCIGSTLDKVRSQPNSPLGSRDTSPTRLVGSSSSQESTPSSPRLPPTIEIDEEDDDFLDSVDDAEIIEVSKANSTTVKKREAPSQNAHPVISNGHYKSYKLPNGYTTNTMPVISSHPDAINEVLQKAIESLRRDLSLANERVKNLEEKQSRLSKRSSLLTLGHMSRETIAFIVLWPFVVHFILNGLRRRRC